MSGISGWLVPSGWLLSVSLGFSLLSFLETTTDVAKNTRGQSEMDWVNVVTNVGFPIAVAVGLGWFTKDRLDKSESQWAARYQEWKEEKKSLIDRLAYYHDKVEGKLGDMVDESRESVNRSTRVMEECLQVLKGIRKAV